MYCLINGRKAIPTGSVKVTMENQRVKSSGEYSYDISFPLDLPENIEAFGLMGRVDVSKATLEDFDDCKFFGANRLLIVGTGTVTGITDTTLKLQIVGGKSSLAYRLQKEDPWIDQITYPDVVSPDDKSKLDYRVLWLMHAGATLGYIGPSLTYAGFTVCNNTTGVVWNGCFSEGVFNDCVGRPMFMANLMYVMRQVFKFLGYEVTENAFSVSPWDNLYIVHINQSKTIAGMLPHWRVKTLLDEFQQLFNATYIIDDQEKTVRIVRATGITAGTTYKAEVADDFSMDYDEEGPSLQPTNNLRYNLLSANEPASVDEVNPEILNNLHMATYDNVSAMNSAVAQMLQQEGGLQQVMTTLFKVAASGYFYYHNNGDEENPDLHARQCAYMQQLTREGNSANGQTTSLRMVPSPMCIAEFRGRQVICPCVDGPDYDPPIVGEPTEEDTYPDYISVEEVLTEGANPPSEEEEAEVLPLAFCMGIPEKENGRLVNMVGSTDFRISGKAQKPWTMALECFSQIAVYIGQLHQDVPMIDRTHPIIYKLLVNGDVPSPSSLFLIRGHRYLCSKLELTVSADGIDSVVQGTFYEILS